MGRVQQKVLFSHFSVVKCKIWKEIMNIWNYDICVWHPPTLIYVLISYVKEIRFWNQYPPTFYAMSSKSAVFFWRLPLGWFYQANFNFFGAETLDHKRLKWEVKINCQGLIPASKSRVLRVHKLKMVKIAQDNWTRQRPEHPYLAIVPKLSIISCLLIPTPESWIVKVLKALSVEMLILCTLK